jgi:hypothetical protein
MVSFGVLLKWITKKLHTLLQRLTADEKLLIGHYNNTLCHVADAAA